MWACEQDVAEINHVRNLANATDISDCAERAKNLRANEWCFSFFGGLILILHVTLDQKAAQRGEKIPENSCQTMERRKALFCDISIPGSTVQEATTARVLFSSPDYNIDDSKLPPQLFLKVCSVGFSLTQLIMKREDNNG